MSKTYVPGQLRKLVAERAGECCEYCRLPERYSPVTFQIDHVIAEKHRGETEESNLAYSCSNCNYHKGSDLTSRDPQTNEITELFHPRYHEWNDHFIENGNEIHGTSAIGRATVFLLQINHSDRIKERALIANLALNREREQT